MRQNDTASQILVAVKARQAAQLKSDLRAVLASKEGRSVLCWLLDISRVTELSFTGNSQTFLHEGMRKVGLEVLSEVMSIQDGLELKQLAEREYSEVNNNYYFEEKEKLEQAIERNKF